MVALLLFLVNNQIDIQQRMRRVQQLREELGPGRGRVPRAAERRFPAINVYASMVEQGDPAFRGVTRFTRSQFDDVVTELRPLIRANRHVRAHVPEPTGQLRSAKLSVPDRVLMTIKFLVFGSSLADLSQQFGLSVPAVGEELRHGVYAIVQGLHYELQWPDLARQQLLRQLFGGFDRAIGVVDGTFTHSFRQPGDFSGHRHANVRAHQIATDALGYVIHVVAGQMGSRHDAYNYQTSDLPALLAATGSNLLADVGYEGCEQMGLILPATSETIANRALRRAFNKRHKSKRSRIEQQIGLLKALFAVVARRWQRTDRQFLAVAIVACCCLYNRWRRLRD